MKRKDFMNEAKLDNTWNKTHSFTDTNGKVHIIATVLWQSNAWKLVSSTDFDSISDYKDKSNIIHECYSQQDLWEYMRDNVFNCVAHGTEQ